MSSRGVLGLLGLSLVVQALLPAAAWAQDKPLIVPQVEGGKQGKVIGRAIVCGVARERTDAVVRAARERMLASVGGPFTEDRYLPALGRAVEFETSLPRPSDEACAKGLAAFESFEKAE